ncbi:MAG: bifunctional DNA-formamidopyrimidine glycosylase/DNA-(apurinic or apyrimidinic site) lyase [Planctomycetia bacterium]|nr:bifunctional DNA-formamidopyrimidine glycosylase/DNA-(apurinic or apyrimidinic site) lyase [Planctomycetia bacterium]
MPELPEVETMRRGIAEIVGSRIAAVERCRTRARPILIEPAGGRFARKLVGRLVAAVDRLGKRVVVRLDSGDALVFEPRMTGLVLLADPPTREHLRLRIQLQAADSPGRARRRSTPRTRELLYWDQRGLGQVRVASPEELDRRYGPGRLGADALAISCEALARVLEGSRRAIKVALLDQRAVAGIGNLYASEILHLSNIHPARRCDQLRSADWARLHEAIHLVLEAAIRHEGSTLSDGTYRNALNQEGGYQNEHRVYDRAGDPCPSCGRLVVRIVQAQRSTFFCPACQARPRHVPKRKKPGQQPATTRKRVARVPRS